jgi:antitoxin MazE
MRATVRKIGNSRGVLIPAPLLAECGIADEVDLRLEGARIVIEAVKPARAGWSEAAAEIAARGEDEAVWPAQFPEEDGGEWEW